MFELSWTDIGDDGVRYFYLTKKNMEITIQVFYNNHRSMSCYIDTNIYNFSENIGIRKHRMDGISKVREFIMSALKRLSTILIEGEDEIRYR